MVQYSFQPFVITVGMVSVSPAANSSVAVPIHSSLSSLSTNRKRTSVSFLSQAALLSLHKLNGNHGNAACNPDKACPCPSHTAAVSDTFLLFPEQGSHSHVNPVVPDTLLNTSLSFCFRMWCLTMTTRESACRLKSLMRRYSP